MCQQFGVWCVHIGSEYPHEWVRGADLLDLSKAMGDLIYPRVPVTVDDLQNEFLELFDEHSFTSDVPPPPPTPNRTYADCLRFKRPVKPNKKTWASNDRDIRAEVTASSVGTTLAQLAPLGEVAIVIRKPDKSIGIEFVDDHYHRLGPKCNQKSSVLRKFKTVVFGGTPTMPHPPYVAVKENAKELPLQNGPSMLATAACLDGLKSDEATNKPILTGNTAEYITPKDHGATTKTGWFSSDKSGKVFSRAAQSYVDIDVDLAGYLRLEAVNQVRTPALMQTLTAKAKRKMVDYDCKHLTYDKQLQLITSAVSVAMDVGVAEQALRHHLKQPDQQVLRDKHARLMQSGTVQSDIWHRHSPFNIVPDALPMKH